MHVAIIGSGRIGATLARRFTETGHEVTIVNSRGAESRSSRSSAELGAHAHAAADIACAAAAGDVVVLAVPFFVYDRLPAAAL